MIEDALVLPYLAGGRAVPLGQSDTQFDYEGGIALRQPTVRHLAYIRDVRQLRQRRHDLLYPINHGTEPNCDQRYKSSNAGHLTKSRGLVGRAKARQVRQAGTERDSVEPGRRSRSRSLGASPRSSTAIRRSCRSCRTAKTRTRAEMSTSGARYKSAGRSRCTVRVAATSKSAL